MHKSAIHHASIRNLRAALRMVAFRRRMVLVAMTGRTRNREIMRGWLARNHAGPVWREKQGIGHG
jgi:hypothetical protein